MVDNPIPHFLSLNDWSRQDLAETLDMASEIKQQPQRFAEAARQKVLFMIFEKPSLRTRVSFETGMARLGGHAINYDSGSSPLRAGKETLEDTVRVVSRYADLIVARLYEHRDLLTMARYSSVPVINGLTNYSHPCQVMADLMTIREHRNRLDGLTLGYFGDANNNVTHSLMLGCAMMGMHVRVACPSDPSYMPDPEVLTLSSALAGPAGGSVQVLHDALEAARGADVVYTDSWMSYHIPAAEKEARVRMLEPYQVNASVMDQADPKAIFMNCLPAARGYEQTAEVIDGPQSVVFDQAENRMHAQNAIMLRLLQMRG